MYASAQQAVGGTSTTPTSGEDFFRIEGTYCGRGTPIQGGQVERWILGQGPRIDSEVELFDELCWRLLGDGIPLWRANLHIGTLHPQTRGFGLRWWRERNVVEDYRILHGSELTDEYLHSPIRVTIERGTPFRRRLDKDTPEYPLLTRIREAGGSDYFALGLNPVSRRFPVVAWATDRPGGFRPADIAAREAINPALAAIVETRAVRHISVNLLDTYLGPQAAQRVLAGQIRRGQGERLQVVIMASDLRGFTGLSDRLPAEAIIELLDDYFETISSSVRAHNGEILKFAGDGVLAIFMADDRQILPRRPSAPSKRRLRRSSALKQSTRGGGSEVGSGCGPGSACISARSPMEMSARPTVSTSP